MTKLLEFRYMQEEAGVDIPFVFHAGETLGDGTDADMNLYDAILLGTKRIGHGYVGLRIMVLHTQVSLVSLSSNIPNS